MRCADSGSAQVERAGQTMQAIVRSVQRVATTITEVSQACEVQERQIGEVSASVAELEQMTQQNAALVEESAAASSALREQAMALDGAVRRFVMPADAVSAAGVAQAAPRPQLRPSLPARDTPLQAPMLAPAAMPAGSVPMPRHRAVAPATAQAARSTAPSRAQMTARVE